MITAVFGPPADALVIDGPGDGDGLELELQDCTAVVISYPDVIVAGVGSIVWAHPGVVVDPQEGSVVYVAPGAQLLHERPGALEQALFSVTTWQPGPS